MNAKPVSTPGLSLSPKYAAVKVLYTRSPSSGGVPMLIVSALNNHADTKTCAS